MFSVTEFLAGPSYALSAAIVLRVALLIFGHQQDLYSAVKFTDIDYYVFTDAARNVASGRSPYLRDTYRYTPLLAWILVPTSWPGLWFDFGKVLFAASDVLAGWLMYRILRVQYSMPTDQALKYASIWLLNPMVAQISTRGSSEGLLIVIVVALLWASLQRKVVLAGCLLGSAVHLKIYPFIYAPAIFWWLGDDLSTHHTVRRYMTPARLQLVLASASVFLLLNVMMFSIYGYEFLHHTFFYHLIRSDHRHNFSLYNVLLYLNASPAATASGKPETFAFVPQLLFSAVSMPLVLTKEDLPSCMLVQTYAFVTFNKVCTSQYFLWYLAFLPFYLPSSTMMRKPRIGVAALLLWIVGQGLWLQQGYQLEFLGRSVFLGLWVASLIFFAINVWILGLMVDDVRAKTQKADSMLQLGSKNPR